MDNINHLIIPEGNLSIAHQQSVIVSFYNAIEDLSDLHNFEMQLYNFLEGSDEGMYDGHEVALDLSHGTLFFYGPNAVILFKTVKPILESESFLKGATVELTFEKGMSIEVTLGVD